MSTDESTLKKIVDALTNAQEKEFTRKTIEFQRMTISSANAAYKNALEHVISDPRFKGNRFEAYDKLTKSAQKLAEITSKIDRKKATVDEKNSEFSLLTAFNPFAWKNAFNDLISEKRTNIFSKLARNIALPGSGNGGLTFEQRVVKKYAGADSMATISDGLSTARGILADSEQENPLNNGLSINGNGPNGGGTFNVNVINDKPISVVLADDKQLIDQITKFLIPSSNNETYSLEQQNEQQRSQQQGLLHLSTLAVNTQKIAQILAKAPLSTESKDKDSMFTNFIKMIGGGALLTAITTLSSKLMLVGSVVTSLLTAGITPLVNVVKKAVDIFKNFSLKNLAGTVGDIITGKNRIKIPPTTTTKVPDVDKRGNKTPTVVKDPLTINKPKNNDKSIKQADKTPNITRPAANEKVLTTENPTKTPVLENVKSKIGNVAKDATKTMKTVAKTGGAFGAGVSLLTTGFALSQNKDYIEQQVKQGKLTREQADQMLTKMNTNTIASNAVTSGGAIIGGIVGSVLGPAGAIIGSTVGGYLGDVVANSDIIKAATGKLSDAIISISNWFDSDDKQIKPNQKVSADHQNAPSLSTPRLQQQDIVPIKDSMTGQQIERAAMSQTSVNNTPIQSNNNITNVNNVSNNHNATFGLGSAADNLSYSGLIHDYRLVGY